jgi:hypothetical protein
VKSAAVAVTLMLCLCLAARPAQATEHPQPGYERPLILVGAVVILVVALVAPSELGAAYFPARNPQPVIAWSWQVPLPPSEQGQQEPRGHRVVGGIDYLPDSGDTRVRGRLGYRYDRWHMFVGLAAALDHQGFGWSPEIGVKFLHHERPGPIDPSLHLVIRGNIPPAVDGLRGVSVLLGWNLY